MKPAPEQTGHGSLVGGEEGSEAASGARLPVRKLLLGSALRQVGDQRRPLLFWLRLLLGLGSLGLIASRVDLGAASVRPSAHLIAAVVLASGLWMLSQAVAALRWKLILADDLLPWSYLLRLYVIGVFFGLFLPTSVGGDAVRALAAARSSQRGGRAIATVLIDRGFGVIATVAYAVLGLALMPEPLGVLRGGDMRWHAPGTGTTMLTLLALGTVLLVLSRIGRVRAVWNEGVAPLKQLVRSPNRLIQVTALAMASQGLVVLLWYTLARGMDFEIPASMFLWLVPVVSLSALLPLTFAGLGVREGVWLILLAGSPIPAPDIVAFSLLYFACNVLVGIIGGLLFVSSGLAVGSTDRVRS